QAARILKHRSLKRPCSSPRYHRRRRSSRGQRRHPTHTTASSDTARKGLYAEPES
ncbi:hypothetical protein EV175_007693, partial [Coemansia sp. RSA 1933]